MIHLLLSIAAALLLGFIGWVIGSDINAVAAVIFGLVGLFAGFWLWSLVSSRLGARRKAR